MMEAERALFTICKVVLKMVSKNDFKQKLTQLRNQCGLSQNRLAAMLCVSAQAVSKWETGTSLPDVDLLVPLAQALGVSTDYLLGSHNPEAAIDCETVCRNLVGYDLSDNDQKMLAAMSTRLTRKQLYRCAKLVEEERLSFQLSLEAGYHDSGKQNLLTKKIDLRNVTLSAIAAVAAPLADLAIQAINRDSNPIQEIISIFRCPDCGANLDYYKDDGSEYLGCGEHRFPIVDGVVDFGTYEQHGNTWSNWMRSYQDYKSKMEQAIAYKLGEVFMQTTSIVVKNMRNRKPSVILDIGSGMASLAGELVKHIDWPCTVILTDISHRVLKYDKRWFEEGEQNPNVSLVYLACDALRLPLKSGTVDMIVSLGGFENIAGDIIKPITEAYRALADTGTLNTFLSLVEERSAKSTQKWLHLIEIDPDPDMPGFFNKIYDMNEWTEILKGIGYRNHEMVLTCHETPPPDGDKFPYNYEIGRWMASVVVCAGKR
jgi:transcriptional regulator with XRE-family HTH domain/ubiquinone/menaquinone biosynthesis C-methylase UbiE